MIIFSNIFNIETIEEIRYKGGDKEIVINFAKKINVLSLSPIKIKECILDFYSLTIDKIESCCLSENPHLPFCNNIQNAPCTFFKSSEASLTDSIVTKTLKVLVPRKYKSTISGKVEKIKDMLSDNKSLEDILKEMKQIAHMVLTKTARDAYTQFLLGNKEPLCIVLQCSLPRDLNDLQNNLNTLLHKTIDEEENDRWFEIVKKILDLLNLSEQIAVLRFIVVTPELEWDKKEADKKETTQQLASIIAMTVARNINYIGQEIEFDRFQKQIFKYLKIFFGEQKILENLEILENFKVNSGFKLISKEASKEVRKKLPLEYKKYSDSLLAFFWKKIGEIKPGFIFQILLSRYEDEDIKKLKGFERALNYIKKFAPQIECNLPIEKYSSNQETQEKKQYSLSDINKGKKNISEIFEKMKDLEVKKIIEYIAAVSRLVLRSNINPEQKEKDIKMGMEVSIILGSLNKYTNLILVSNFLRDLCRKTNLTIDEIVNEMLEGKTTTIEPSEKELKEISTKENIQNFGLVAWIISCFGTAMSSTNLDRTLIEFFSNTEELGRIMRLFAENMSKANISMGNASLITWMKGKFNSFAPKQCDANSLKADLFFSFLCCIVDVTGIFLKESKMGVYDIFQFREILDQWFRRTTECCVATKFFAYGKKQWNNVNLNSIEFNQSTLFSAVLDAAYVLKVISRVIEGISGSKPIERFLSLFNMKSIQNTEELVKDDFYDDYIEIKGLNFCITYFYLHKHIFPKIKTFVNQVKENKENELNHLITSLKEDIIKWSWDGKMCEKDLLFTLEYRKKREYFISGKEVLSRTEIPINMLFNILFGQININKVNLKGQLSFQKSPFVTLHTKMENDLNLNLLSGMDDSIFKNVKAAVENENWLESIKTLEDIELEILDKFNKFYSLVEELKAPISSTENFTTLSPYDILETYNEIQKFENFKTVEEINHLPTIKEKQKLSDYILKYGEREEELKRGFEDKKKKLDELNFDKNILESKLSECRKKQNEQKYHSTLEKIKQKYNNAAENIYTKNQIESNYNANIKSVNYQIDNLENYLLNLKRLVELAKKNNEAIQVISEEKNPVDKNTNSKISEFFSKFTFKPKKDWNPENFTTIEEIKEEIQRIKKEIEGITKEIEKEEVEKKYNVEKLTTIEEINKEIEIINKEIERIKKEKEKEEVEKKINLMVIDNEYQIFTLTNNINANITLIKKEEKIAPVYLNDYKNEGEIIKIQRKLFILSSFHQYLCNFIKNKFFKNIEQIEVMLKNFVKEKKNLSTYLNRQVILKLHLLSNESKKINTLIKDISEKVHAFGNIDAEEFIYRKLKKETEEIKKEIALKLQEQEEKKQLREKDKIPIEIKKTDIKNKMDEIELDYKKFLEHLETQNPEFMEYFKNKNAEEKSNINEKTSNKEAKKIEIAIGKNDKNYEKEEKKIEEFKDKIEKIQQDYLNEEKRIKQIDKKYDDIIINLKADEEKRILTLIKKSENEKGNLIFSRFRIIKEIQKKDIEDIFEIESYHDHFTKKIEEVFKYHAKLLKTSNNKVADLVKSLPSYFSELISSFTKNEGMTELLLEQIAHFLCSLQDKSIANDMMAIWFKSSVILLDFIKAVKTMANKNERVTTTGERKKVMTPLFCNFSDNITLEQLFFDNLIPNIKNMGDEDKCIGEILNWVNTIIMRFDSDLLIYIIEAIRGPMDNGIEFEVQTNKGNKITGNTKKLTEVLKLPEIKQTFYPKSVNKSTLSLYKTDSAKSPYLLKVILILKISVIISTFIALVSISLSIATKIILSVTRKAYKPLLYKKISIV